MAGEKTRRLRIASESPSDPNYSPSLENLAWNPGDLIGFDCGDHEFPQPFILGFVSDFRKVSKEDYENLNGFGISYKALDGVPEFEQWDFRPEMNKVLGLWDPRMNGFPREKSSDYEAIDLKDTAKNHTRYVATAVYSGKEAVLKGLRETDDLAYYADLIEKYDLNDFKEFISSAQGNHGI